MTEDFILEEDDSGGSSEQQPFLIAVGALVAVGVLAIACIAIVLMVRDPQGGNGEEIAAIETQNAMVAVTNEAVTRIIAAMETEAARPTDTPEPTSTPRATAIPTNTPRPTNTPVVQQAEDTATPDFSGGTGIGLGGSTPTPIGALGSGSSGSGSLPQTGIATWAATLAALLFVGILVVARRLRSN